MNFNDKVILITGAASGIGAHAAIHLSKLGASVAIVDRHALKLSKTACKIRKARSPEPLEIVANVNEDAERIIVETIDRFGKLNVLVNNAAIAYNTDILGPLEAYDDLMNTNVRSLLALTKLAVPHLEATKGNVVNVSSIIGHMVMKNLTFYSMTKAAVDHFTRCAAVELAPKGIRVNSVCPGVIRTPMWFTHQSNPVEITRFFERYSRMQLVNRIGEVDDTSNAIAFLASDLASFITGNLLYIDGGLSLVK